MIIMNDLLIKEFEKLVNQIKKEYISAQMDNNRKEMIMHQHRLKNIKKSLSMLKKIPFEIKNANDVKDVPGFGKGTLRRITEILETGKLSEIESDNALITEINALSEVIGIGNKTAEKMINFYGIHSVPELKKAVKEGKIEVSSDILLGLKYWRKVQGNIPRKEIMITEKYLKSQLNKLNPNFELIICGSYRRGKPTSGDIDVLIYNPTMPDMAQINKSSFLEKFVDQLTAEKFLLDHLTYENYKIKYMGFCKLNDYPIRRIDIKLIPYESFYTALLYFTGPAELNEHMRSIAKKNQMRLNEYGIYKIKSDGSKQKIKITSEEDVFKILGMKYLTPVQRESYALSKTKNI